MSKKILIVDDDPASRKLIQSHLESHDFKVTSAIDGGMVMVTARKDKPDAIIMDLIMPKVGGSEAVARLQQDEQLKHIPILFLTAVGSADGVQNTDFDIQVGSVTYATLIKPISAQALLEALEKLL